MEKIKILSPYACGYKDTDPVLAVYGHDQMRMNVPNGTGRIKTWSFHDGVWEPIPTAKFLDTKEGFHQAQQFFVGVDCMKGLKIVVPKSTIDRYE